MILNKIKNDRDSWEADNQSKELPKPTCFGQGKLIKQVQYCVKSQSIGADSSDASKERQEREKGMSSVRCIRSYP
jgi:hypothetical protein